MSRSGIPYVGRFAPSPTGPLHMGSLVAALASFLDAKARQGLWLLRIEDLDPPREQAGAAEAILQSLQQHGLQWDGSVLWQSQRHAAYSAALEQLARKQLLFPCTCSRKQLQLADRYSGRCRNRTETPKTAYALRVKVDNRPICFNDRIQGWQEHQSASESGDFVVKRKDGLFAYQLAVVVDDEFQGVTDIVRGADLLDSTPRQIYLQKLLGFTTPKYAHVAVLVDHQGNKLSKQNLAPALDRQQCCQNLLTALHYLNQPSPPVAARKHVDSLLHWALTHWQAQNLPRRPEILHSPPHPAS